MRVCIQLILLMLVIAFAGVCLAEPEIFSDKSFEQDRIAAGETDKLHVIYFTASWCPPCQQMKKTTWVDESLVGWLEEHAIVSSVDVDEFNEISQDHFVSAMPTIAVYENDEELARTVGYQDAVEFKSWLEGVRAGEIRDNQLAELEAEYMAELEMEGWFETLAEQMEQATTAVEFGHDEQATKLYAEIWDEIYDNIEQMDYTDIEFHDETARLLAYRHEPAHELFTELRNREEDLLRAGDVSWDRLTGWAVLNDFLNENEKTIAWIERRLDSGQNLPQYNVMSTLCEEALYESQRFDLMDRAMDLVQRARDDLDSYQQMMSYMFGGESEEDEEMRAYFEESIRESLAYYHAVALGAGNEADARTIAEMLIEYDDTEASRDALRKGVLQLNIKPMPLESE